jgi:hypothetical protein
MVKKAAPAPKKEAAKGNQQPSLEALRTIPQTGEAVVYFDDESNKFDALVSNVFTNEASLSPDGMPTLDIVLVLNTQHGGSIHPVNGVRHISAGARDAGKYWMTREEFAPVDEDTKDVA